MRSFFYRCVKNFSWIYLCIVFLFAFELIISEVPDEIYVQEMEDADKALDFPFVVQSIDSEVPGEDRRLCSLLGIIPVKEVTVSVVDEQKIYPIGEIVGIYTECAGVFVIDTCEIESINGEIVNPAKHQLQTGDYITAINGIELDCKEDMVELIASSQGNSIQLTYMRNEKEHTCELTPVKAKNGEYMLGIWVKDDLAGVGTLTFVDANGRFGALGHGMGNGENQELLQIEDGDVYVSKLLGIEKGEKGDPGEVKGVIYYGANNHLGEISSNTKIGIYGTLDDEECQEYYNEVTAYDVGHKQDIQTGKAQIISNVSGKKEMYDIEITYVDYLSGNSNKGLHIEVTDPELLELTGGIVQGMSGSPIIQNGKVIGAVTHVLINDPTKGYGIFIEEMLEHN